MEVGDLPSQDDSSGEDSPEEVSSRSGSDPKSKSEPTVVGLGASAGGLAALSTFFQHVPEDSTDLAFVVVVHLSPEHESHLAELLQVHARMPVEQVTGDVPLKGGHVYVIPPGRNLSAIDSHLRLSGLEEEQRKRAPIDHFFRTLSRAHDGHAVGIVLTGTGSDGTLGIKEIKERGGLTIAQSPAEAEYDAMPQSAIATGLVDLVLPLAEMPARLLRFVCTHPRVTAPDENGQASEDDEQSLQQIFTQIKAHTGRDFTQYKRSTILRRTTRRMQLRQLEALPAYADLLGREPEEARHLADDLLITVTRFFRDPEVFEKLETDMISQLFDEKRAGDPVRVWSVGCATGEEAYTLAILLLEAAARREQPGGDPPEAGALGAGAPPLQVFASDLHEHSLRRAREGFYPGDIEADISEDRLQRFFEEEDGGYRVRKEVRELVVFAPHDLLHDPPFSKLDLIVCRNLLIYLQRGVQQDIERLFHYALRPGGALVLGTAETTGPFDLFRAEDKKRGLYRRRDVPAPPANLPVFPLTQLAGRAGENAPAEPEAKRNPVHYGALHQRVVERYAPPSLLVSPAGNVVHLSEHAGRYLTHPGGELTAGVFKLVREELRLELRAALHVARQQGKARRSPPVPVQIGGDLVPVALHVRPALDPDQEGFALVIFEEREAEEREAEEREAEEQTPGDTEGGDAERGEVAPEDAGRASELQAELEQTRQRLQTVIEEYEASQEEMQASNEELQSTNEELRSTMEELETSKEELQSMNEELQTVNQENRHKVAELRQLSGDLQNLLASTDIATLFLDRELRILRFTPRADELFNVRPADQGRPLSDLTHRLGYDALSDDARQVLRRLTPVEREVQGDDGRWYLTRVLPYRSAQDRIEGVVVTFVEITGRKRAEEALREAKNYAERIITTLHEPLVVLTSELRVQAANSTFYEQFEVSRKRTEGRLIYDLGNGQWNIPALRRLLEDVLPSDSVFNDFEVTHEFANIGRRVMVLNGRRLEGVDLILLGIQDVTERKQGEEDLRELNQTLEERVTERTRQVRELSSKLTMAEQQERRRISQILHDDLQQRLFGVQMKMTFLRQAAERSDAERNNAERRSAEQDQRRPLAKQVDEAYAWIGEAIKTTRQLSVDLSPPVLEGEGLTDALGWLQTQMKELHHLKVELEAERAFNLPDKDMRVLLFQIVRELLFNVVKHAGTDRAAVELREEDGRLVIRVSDEGRGFDAESAQAEHEGGFGLFSVRERLSLVGGRMKIDAHPGRGTRITVYAPEMALS